MGLCANSKPSDSRRICKRSAELRQFSLRLDRSAAHWMAPRSDPLLSDRPRHLLRHDPSRCDSLLPARQRSNRDPIQTFRRGESSLKSAFQYNSTNTTNTSAKARISPKRTLKLHWRNPLPSELEQHGSFQGVRGHILFTIAIIGALLLSWKLIHVIEIVYVSGLFAVVLMPVVRHMMTWKIGKYHLSRPIVVVILLIGIFGGITLFFWLGLPPVLRDLRSFAQDLPARIPALMDKLKHLPLADKLGVESMSHRAETALAATASYIFASLPEWGTHILDIGTAVILTVYFILEGGLLYNYLLSFLPLTPRIRLGATLERAETRVSRWLIGQLLLMSIQGIYSIIVFGSLHIRYFALLGILMGITNIIPIAGNLVTIIIVFSVAALDSWTTAILVLVFYGIYSQVETAYLTPRHHAYQRRSHGDLCSYRSYVRYCDRRYRRRARSRAQRGPCRRPCRRISGS